MLAEDQFAAITIVGDEDTPLGLGKMQYLTVVDAARIVLDDGRDIMPLISQERGNPVFDVFIEQKRHNSG